MSSRNTSFFAVPAAFAVAHLPHVYAAIGSRSAYDNSMPHTFKDNISKLSSLDEKTKQHYLRAKRASENNYETVGLFAAGVAAANAAGVSTQALNTLSWGYVACRILYNFIYIQWGGSTITSVLRSAAWSVSMFHSVGLFIAAGLAKI